MSFNEGDRVEISLAGGRKALCRVLSVRRGTVYVTTESQYAVAGAAAEALIGVPEEDARQAISPPGEVRK